MSISSSSHLTPDDVARHSFGTVRRGFDPNEVRAYLESLAVSLRGVADRERQLLDELADAEYRAGHPVLDEGTLTAALGAETARVLHSAHEVAAEMLAKSEAEANRLLTEGREEIQQTRAHTEARLAEKSDAIETAAAELQDRIEQQSAATMEKASHEADTMLELAREKCRSMVEEAQGLRARVLADLSKRRKVLHVQIEQLRAGREQLAETVQDVRRSVDTIASDLFAAEDNARLAAEAAGREALDRVDTATPEELAAQLLSDEHEAAAEAAAAVQVGAEMPTEVRTDTKTDAPIETQAPTGEQTDTGPATESDGAVEGATAAPSGPKAPYDRLGGQVPSDGTDGVQIIGAVVAGQGLAAEDPAGPEQGHPPADEAPGPEEVDALFAKLRAARQNEGPEPVPESVPDADTASPASAPAAAAGSGPEPSPKSGPTSSPKSGPTSSPKSGPKSSPKSPPKGAAERNAGEGPESVDGADDDGPPEERSPQAVRRDELIDPIVTTLSRRLKRTLQDNQNELLDKLRSNGSRWSIDLLPDETEHVDGFSTAAVPALEQSAAAGVSFAGQRGVTGPKSDVLLGIAHDLAEAVVGPLRRRLAGGDGLESADESVVAEHVGSAFREWKGERIERLAGDHVVAAFSAGTIAAAEGASSAQLEWLAASDSEDTPCPDCEDNGLTGSLAPGEEFPTGHRHPPAHPGCRCLLVLSAT